MHMRDIFLVLVFAASALAQRSFETAAIHMYPAGARSLASGNYIHASPDGLTVRFANLRAVIGWAYDIPGQVFGPDWLQAERCDIGAKASGPAKPPEIREMLKTLLAERFSLKAHHEIRELPAVVISVARGGSKNLQRVNSDDPPSYELRDRKIIARNVTVERLAYYLENRPPQGVGARARDQTGLEGSFDLSLDLNDFDANDPAFSGDYEKMREAYFGFVAATMEKQYGLRLEQRKIPLECLVVDGMNRSPTAN
jgi:uncharacterized protein (TIGR03435 family)